MDNFKMEVAHVNLAKGFGGGERQTELLVKMLAEHHGLRQVLVCRKDSPLIAILEKLGDLRIIIADHQLAGHPEVGGVSLVHAHEAKAVHWACLHNALNKVPYILTRRMDSAVKKKKISKFCYKRAARRVAISRSIQKSLQQNGWGNVDLIYDAKSGFNSDPEKTKLFRGEFHGKFLVGHAGSVVDKTKGQRVLLKVACEMLIKNPKIHFVFLGEGEDFEKLKMESSDLPNVSWLGFKENISDYLAGLDVFAFPSHNEGLGSVLLDVFDAGVPVIASNVGGIPDIVIDGTTGLLFDNGDYKSLALGIDSLYKSKNLRDRLSKNAKLNLENFSPEIMAYRYYSTYCDILGYEL